MKVSEEIAQKMKAFWNEINKIQWTPGTKHPSTHPMIFRNVWGYDTIRNKVKSRCLICGGAISDNEKERSELVFACDQGKCLCQKPYETGLKAHQVCDVCQSMYRSVYVNWGLKDRNYFKNLDEELKSLRGGGEGRRRMGLE